MKDTGRSLLLWALVFFGIVLIYNSMLGSTSPGGYASYAFSDFLGRVENGQIAEVSIRGNDIEGRTIDGNRFITYSPDYPNLVDKLNENGVRFDAKPLETRMNSFFGILLSYFPIFILIAVWIFFMRQMQGGGSKAMGFGKSKAKLLNENNTKVTFADVAGIDEAKEELTEIVEFLMEPSKFQKLGGKIPKGCLLIGPPGTGKTLLARSIAGEANVPFFSISGSDFVEMFVGVGASRVRDMFEQGKKNAPCIIFIDEIDAVGRHRGIGLGGGNDEREQTLNQLLVEMDGFEANEGVIIIAATNRPDVLDPALLRPGRFDRQVTVPLPDIKGREEILKVHLKNIAKGPDIDSHIIARGTPGFSGADLANLVNEGALYAARLNKKVVTLQDLENAKDKVMMGKERRSMVMQEEERRLTAYHEGGHAIVALHLEASDPIHKATIIPRGRALGLVMRLPKTDRVSITRDKLKADMAVAMGGRVSEEMIFGYGKVTSGASSDIKQATKMAKAMVREWGMSDKVGPIFLGDDDQDMYSGQKKGASSTETEILVDREIKAILEEAYDLAKKILTENSHELKILAEALLEYETLSGSEIEEVLAGKKLDKVKVSDTDEVTETAASSFISKKPKKRRSANVNKAADKENLDEPNQSKDDN